MNFKVDTEVLLESLEDGPSGLASVGAVYLGVDWTVVVAQGVNPEHRVRALELTYTNILHRKYIDLH